MSIQHLLRKPGFSHVLCALVMTTIVGGWAFSAQAQVATVAALERVTQKKSGAAGAWHDSHKGDVLNISDSLRTGKRSKADVKFTDGSLLRLGQLSSVVIRSEKGVSLTGGQLLYAALQPGRVLAGSAVAEIKGSVAIVTMNPDGSTEFSLFSGAMDVVAPKQTVPLPPGHWVTAYPDGSLSEIRVAPPIEFTFGSFLPDLTAPPVESPFVGSDANLRLRAAPQRLGLDQYTARVERNGAIPFNDTPQPQRPPTTESTVRLGGSPSHLSPLRLQVAARDVGNAPGGTGPNGSVTQAANDLNTDPANQHIGNADQGLGRFNGTDEAVIGVLSSGGTQAYGARLHSFGALGHWYYDLSAVPLRQRLPSAGGHTTTDISALPTAFVAYRDHWGDVEIGRQRFLEGPTQATLFGSLVRPGGRETMDAIRVRPDIGPGRKLEVAYLYDAFVRNLPYRQAGAQHGFYGRAALQKPYGNFGVNLLKYTNIPGPDTLGGSFDFAVPVVRNEVEFYSELGRDPFRRDLAAAGLAFPGLHERTDVDLFLEYARVKDSRIAAGEQSELALRAYRHVGRNTYVVSDLSHFFDHHTIFTIGVAFGAQSYRGNAEH